MTHSDYKCWIGAAALMRPYFLIAAHIEALREEYSSQPQYWGCLWRVRCTYALDHRNNFSDNCP